MYKTPKSIQETIEIMAVAENGIFERYCKFLNSLDCNYKITINNKNKNMDELRDKVLIAEKNDGFNNYRRIYNDIIEEKIPVDISHILGNLITVIFDYQILRKPLKILSL